MKKPSEEEFIKEYNDISGKRSVKIKTIAAKYDVSRSSAYNWEREFIEKKPPNPDPTPKEKSFSEWIADYKEPAYKQPDYIQNFDVGDDDIMLVFISDLHIGSRECDVKRLGEDMKEIMKYKNTYLVIVGDIIDDGPAAPGSLTHEQILSYKSQIAMSKSFVDEMGDRILAITSGCHSHFTYKVTGYFLEEELVKNTLSGIFLGDGGILKLKVGDNIYDIFMSHKLSGGTKKSPATGLLNVNEMSIDFDIGVVAHKHTPSVTTVGRRGKEVHMVNCGSYKNLDIYARKGGYTPAIKGIPCVYLSSKNKQIISAFDFKNIIGKLMKPVST